MGNLLKNNKASIEVLRSSDKWFGITYAEDKDIVIKAFEELINKGIYKEKLYN